MSTPFDAARAALRLGGQVHAVAVQYAITINGETVGVVSSSEYALIQELMAKLKLENATNGDAGKLRMLSKDHLCDLARDLGISVEGVTKMELIQALVDKGFTL